MKVNIELDLTPEEARRFFGLPDITPLQEQIMERIQDQIKASADPAYLGKLASQMVTGGMQSVDSFQRAFMDMVSSSAKGKSSSKKTSKD
ncbi:MAG: DUF6489 family protein [Pseudomonadales bacterium]